MAVIVRLPQVPSETRVLRRPGRPRKVNPVVEQSAYDAEVDRARKAHVDGDDLVGGAPLKNAADVLDAVIEKLAEESAALAFDSMRAGREGRDASEARSRRVRGLVALAALVRDREVLRRESGGISSETENILRTDFLGEVEEVARDVVADGASAFVSRVRAKIT